MPAVHEAVKAEACDNETGGDADASRMIENAHKKRKRQQHDRHRQNMACRDRPQGGKDGTLAPLKKRAREGEWPAHTRVETVIGADRDHREPE
jgi:hypothetical protein